MLIVAQVIATHLDPLELAPCRHSSLPAAAAGLSRWWRGRSLRMKIPGDDDPMSFAFAFASVRTL